MTEKILARIGARLALIATALIFGCPLAAEVYLTQEQALNLVFGSACTQSHDPRSITPELRESLEKADVANADLKTAHFFTCRQEGAATQYALIDSEVGKHLPITYIVGIDANGSVSRVEVMVFREVRGWEAREASFTQQFKGKGANDSLAVGRAIKNRTGATLSSLAIAKGVKRALFLWRYFYGGAT